MQTRAARQHWYKSEDAKRRGSAVHDVIEFWAQRGEWPSYDRAYEPYVKSFRALLDEYGLTQESWTMTEATVYHDEDEWAGTLDGVLRMEPVTRASAELCARLNRVDQYVDLLVDTKSREGEGARFYAQQPLQLAGYRHARWVLVGGRNVEMPPVHGGAVLQLRPDGFTLRPVRCGEEEYAVFCQVLAVARWMLSESGGERATQVQAFPVPSEWMWRRPEDAVPRVEGQGQESGTVTPLRRPAAKRSRGSAAGADGGSRAARGRTARSGEERPAESPTIASLRAGMPPLPRPHPNSPYGDDIPF
jgi:hypothetical protein